MPFVGQALAELIDLVVRPSLDRRLQAWGEHVDELLEELSTKSITPDQLANEEEWISALAKATQVATSTHLDSKLVMLRRILKSSAIDLDADHAIVKRMMKFVEDLEPVHFKLLAVADDPNTFLKSRNCDVAMLLRSELTKDASISSVRESRARALVQAQVRDAMTLSAVQFDMLWADLAAFQLIRNVDDSGIGRKPSVEDSWLSAIGIELLRWVSDDEMAE